MKRKIIKIDEAKCNGCGLCAKACHEGAIEMVNGKAKLTKEHYCDGLGDCLPACPTGAIYLDNGIAHVNPKVCIGCGLCAKKCEHGATRVLELNPETGKIEKDPCCCVGCGECVKACPASAWTRSETPLYKVIIGGRTGRQTPRLGKMFLNWASEETILAVLGNWQKFSAWVMDYKPEYLHGGHLIDRAGYKKFKENNEGSRYADMSFEEYQNFFDNKMTELMKKYGSDVIMAVLDTNPDATDEAISEWVEEALKNDYDYFQLITSFDRSISRHENKNFNNEEFNKKFDKWRNDSRFD